VDLILLFIEISGTLAFALSGIIEARRKKMDFIGVYTASMLTAFGGGTLRDIFLNRYPLFWIQNYNYPVIILLLSFISIIFFRKNMESNIKKINFFLNVFDSLGLGLFATLGTSIALQSNHTIFLSCVIGVITATFGGVLRDIICNEIPNIFKRNELYASCAFLGSLFYAVLFSLGVQDYITFPLSILITFTSRILALRFNLKLPG
jgi:uncharacterized membrane protein YeiH